MEKELKRALILTAALVLAAVAAFLAAVASTGAFTRIGLDFTAGDAETRLYVQPGETPPPNKRRVTAHVKKVKPE